MGKKKSVVLMVLLTIVIVVLCAITAFPVFTIPGTNGVKKWNPAVNQYDLGADLGGGYYTYYYPEGVISEAEYKSNQAGGTNETEYVQHGGLYLSKDPDADIIGENDTVLPYFEEVIANAADEIAARYAAMGYSDYRVAIVDDYSIRVDLPASETNVGSVMANFANVGDITIEKGGETIDELKSKDAKVTDLIKGFSVHTQYKVSYVKVEFTKAGKAMLNAVKGSLTAASAGSSSATTLDIKVGETAILSIYQDYIDTKDRALVPVAYEENEPYVKSLSVLLNSALENGGYDVTFRALASSDIRVYEAVGGEATLTAVYVAILAISLAIVVFLIVKMGRFGVVNAYATLSYFIITALCFAFISKSVFEITLGSVLVYLVGLLLVNVFNARVYNAIKAEFSLGKTVESSVKLGYNKTLAGLVDIYAVLLLGSVALLIGAAGLHTLAVQAIICVVTGAFCNLLWGRAINFTFLSASKNKYKYFRFVREDDDDE
ncbi:MAG: hypothetical protein IKD47_03040 [Clostridia bacterium]|nr:hypothetical protein [Clostridia bacterium]